MDAARGAAVVATGDVDRVAFDLHLGERIDRDRELAARPGHPYGAGLDGDGDARRDCDREPAYTRHDPITTPSRAARRRDLLLADVDAQARTADAAERRDHRPALLIVLEADAQLLPHPFADDRVIAEKSLGDEHAHDGFLRPRPRDVHALLAGLVAVADARQQIGDGIGHRHAVTSSP